MKLAFTLFLCGNLFGASRYFVSGGVDNNWGTTGNWSLTDGGAGGQTVPSASDDVHFTANSPNCTVNTSARVALTLDFTGYTNTITMSQQITVSGSVTLVSAMTISGAGALLVNAAATLTSNTKTWPNDMTISGAVTYTLADNWTVNGTLTIGSGSNTTTVNGNQFTAHTSFTAGVSTGVVTGTTTMLMNGTGTLTGPSSTGSLRSNFTINTAGTITLATGNFRYNTNTFTCTAGTVDASNADLIAASAGTTFGCAEATWKSITFNFAGTYTLNEDMFTTGLCTFGAGSSGQTINSGNINCPAGLTYTGTSSTLQGTTVFKLTGTGTLTAASLTSGRIANPISIQAGSGTISITSPFTVDIGAVSLVSGTVVASAGNTWSSATPPLGTITVQ